MSSEKSKDKPVSRLYDELSGIIGDRKITVTNIVSVVTLLMKTVDKYTDVKGIQKKELVLAVVTKVVNETMSDDDERNNILYVVEGVLPTVIDTIIQVDKGQLLIKLKKTCFSWCP